MISARIPQKVLQMQNMIQPDNAESPYGLPERIDGHATKHLTSVKDRCLSLLLYE